MAISRLGRRLVVAVAAVGLVVTAAACSDSKSEGGDAPTRVISADNGEITIPVKPERIVATGYAVPPLVEADAPLVGISTWTRGLALMNPEERKRYDDLPKVSGETAKSTNYEAIAKLTPDLILIGVPAPVLGDVDVKRLEAIAPVVAIGPSLPSAWRELTQRQLDAAGHLESYEQSKDTYDKKAAELKAKYATVLPGLKFGHLGAYAKPTAGTFEREFAGSWGTNIAGDVGVEYYGAVKNPKGGSSDVSENVSLESIPESLGEADAISYTVNEEGNADPSVQAVLDSPLFKNLPAVKAGRVYGFQYVEAATYGEALMTLDSIDKALAPLLAGAQ